MLADERAVAGGTRHVADGPRPAAHPARATGPDAPADVAFHQFLRRPQPGRRGDPGLTPARCRTTSTPGSASWSAARRSRFTTRTSSRSPALAARLASGGLGFEELLVVRRRELNPSHVYTYHVEGFGAGGGLYRASVKQPGALKELVASPEGQILDCDLSFDGREILFSWRRKQGEGYQVFVINADGTNLRQLTDGPHHNYNACWLPDGGIAFLTTRSARFAYCWISPVGVLHRMERDGSRVTRLSANIVNDFTPSVLEDGRIIYSRWEYVDKPAIPIQSLWTIHPDGTGAGRLLRQPRAQPGHVHGGALDSGHGQGAVPAHQPQRPVPRRHRHRRHRLRQQRRRRHPQPDARGGHRPGGQRRRQPHPRPLRKPVPAGRANCSWSPSAARCWCAATTARKWPRCCPAAAASASTTRSRCARAPGRRCWPAQLAARLPTRRPTPLQVA